MVFTFGRSGWLLFGLLLLAILFWCQPIPYLGQTAIPAACRALGPAGQLPRSVVALPYGDGSVLCSDDFAVFASARTHGPLWSAEHLTRAQLSNAAVMPRISAFHADARFAGSAQLEDYRHSGYDRGHMTPSGDEADPDAQAQSFALSNVVPQTAALNRGIWEGIESAVRHLAERDGELYVVTGPAFDRTAIASIGRGHVYVPVATWKAVYDPSTGAAGVYICTNVQQSPTCNEETVAMLRGAVGVDPFPALPESVKATLGALPDPEPSRYVHRDDEGQAATRSE